MGPGCMVTFELMQTTFMLILQNPHRNFQFKSYVLSINQWHQPIKLIDCHLKQFKICISRQFLSNIFFQAIQFGHSLLCKQQIVNIPQYSKSSSTFRVQHKVLKKHLRNSATLAYRQFPQCP